MRIFKFIIPALLICINSFGQGSGGINWVKSNIRTAFDFAKAENHPVFIEVYSPTCHVCQSFAPVLDSYPVGKFYNPKFVSYKLDINTPEAQAFLAKQNIWIPSLPMFLYFDKNVHLIHIAVMGEGMNSDQTVVNAAGVALDTDKRFDGYNERYAKGDRNPNFLIDYAFFSRITKDTLTNMKVMNEYVKTQSPSTYNNATNLAVLQKIIMDSDNALFKHLMVNYQSIYQKNDKNVIKATAENILMSSLYCSRAINYSVQRIHQIQQDLLKIGIDKKSVENRTLVPELNVLFKQNQAGAAIIRIEKYIKEANAGPKEYEFLSKFVKTRTKDTIALAKANEWAKKSK
jgi:thiol-disulfide isomerase/thioredoxin